MKFAFILINYDNNDWHTFLSRSRTIYCCIFSFSYGKLRFRSKLLYVDYDNDNLMPSETPQKKKETENVNKIIHQTKKKTSFYIVSHVLIESQLLLSVAMAIDGFG